MKDRTTLKRLGILLPTLLVCNLSWAVNFYRYKNDDGVTVINSTIPPEYVANGYEVLNNRGIVVDRVAPAPTAEELEARSAAEKAEAERLAREQAQREADQALLRLYGHPDDAVRARDRKLQEIDSLIKLKQGNIQLIESRITDAQAKAANLERSGRNIPDTLLDEISMLEKNVSELETEIDTQEQERQQASNAFDAQIDRLRELVSQHDDVDP